MIILVKIPHEHLSSIIYNVEVCMLAYSAKHVTWYRNEKIKVLVERKNETLVQIHAMASTSLCNKNSKCLKQ
jgi:hypothetical protein